MEILGGGTIGGTSSAGPAAGSIKLHTQFNQGVIIGVRYAFNSAGCRPRAMQPRRHRGHRRVRHSRFWCYSIWAAPRSMNARAA